jgi:hypothetical protein
MLQNCWHPAINLLASAKAISDETALNEQVRTAATPRAHGAFDLQVGHCDEPRNAAYPPVRNDTTTGVGYPQTVDNHVDIRSLSIRPTLPGHEGELLR